MNERTYLNLTSDIYCFADDLAQALLVMDGTQRPETLDLVGLDWDTVQMDRGLNEPTAYAAKRVFQQTLGIDPADSTMPWPPEDESADESLDHPTDDFPVGAVEKMISELDMDADGISTMLTEIRADGFARPEYLVGILVPMARRLLNYAEVIERES